MLRIRSKRRRRIHVVISIGCCRDIGRWFLLGISMLRLRSRRRKSRIHVVIDIGCCRDVHWLLLRRSMFSLRRWWRKCRIHVVVDSGCWWGVGHLFPLSRNMLRLWSRRRCGIHVVIDVSCCWDVGRWLLLGRSRLRLHSRRSRCRIHVVVGIGIGCWRGSHQLILGINMLRCWSWRKRRIVHVVIDSGCYWSLSHVVLEGGMLCFRSRRMIWHHCLLGGKSLGTVSRSIIRKRIELRKCNPDRLDGCNQLLSNCGHRRKRRQCRKCRCQLRWRARRGAVRRRSILALER
mmetsp:Transcript_18868/g.65822  ORF Transcript_18868/g.65822 Transcript_18868/m.65822 type:complete len:290 (-) Transcript_18868:827-1696(-)